MTNEPLGERLLNMAGQVDSEPEAALLEEAEERIRLQHQLLTLILELANPRITPEED